MIINIDYILEYRIITSIKFRHWSDFKSQTD